MKPFKLFWTWQQLHSKVQLHARRGRSFDAEKRYATLFRRRNWLCRVELPLGLLRDVFEIRTERLLQLWRQLVEIDALILNFGA